MTTAVDMGNVYQGIYTALAADFATTSIGTAFYYGTAPETVALPLAVFSAVDWTPATDTFTSDGFRARIQVTIMGTEDAGVAALMDIADTVRGARHRLATLSMTGHTLQGFELAIERGPFREGDGWRIDLDFIVTGYAD